MSKTSIDEAAPFDWPGPGTVRRAGARDVPALAELYRGTVARHAPARYTPEQVVAWAAAPDDTARFTAFVLEHHTLLLETNGQAAAFCGVGEEGYVASLYVSAGHTRRGFGSRLLAYALASRFAVCAMREFETAASFLSRPVFAAAGFDREHVEETLFNGVHFKRWRMRGNGPRVAALARARVLRHTPQV